MFGYSYHKETANPVTKPLFISCQKWYTEFTVSSTKEMEFMKNKMETNESFHWTRLFRIDRMETPFICLSPLTSEELLKSVLLATKTGIDADNGLGIDRTTSLEEALKSDSKLEKALNCSETMKKMFQFLNKKGQIFFRKWKKDLIVD